MSFSDNFIALLTIKCFYEGKYNKMLIRMTHTNLSLPMHVCSYIKLYDYTVKKEKKFFYYFHFINC